MKLLILLNLIIKAISVFLAGVGIVIFILAILLLCACLLPVFLIWRKDIDREFGYLTGNGLIKH